MSQRPKISFHNCEISLTNNITLGLAWLSFTVQIRRHFVSNRMVELELIKTQSDIIQIGLI